MHLILKRFWNAEALSHNPCHTVHGDLSDWTFRSGNALKGHTYQIVCGWMNDSRGHSAFEILKSKSVQRVRARSLALFSFMFFFCVHVCVCFSNTQNPLNVIIIIFPDPTSYKPDYNCIVQRGDGKCSIRHFNAPMVSISNSCKSIWF